MSDSVDNTRAAEIRSFVDPIVRDYVNDLVELSQSVYIDNSLSENKALDMSRSIHLSFMGYLIGKGIKIQ